MKYTNIKSHPRSLIGSGPITRDVGRLPPKFRALFAAIKNEPITSLTVWRKPIGVSKFLNFISGGAYQKSLEAAGFDSLFHLAICINGRYNFHKQAVLTLERGCVPSGAESMDVPLGNREITIEELVNRTSGDMGLSDFTSYDAVHNNCQRFIQYVLSANRLSSPTTTAFIKQDIEKVLSKLPAYSGVVEKLGKLAMGAQAALNRQIEGEGGVYRPQGGVRERKYLLF